VAARGAASGVPPSQQSRARPAHGRVLTRAPVFATSASGCVKASTQQSQRLRLPRVARRSFHRTEVPSQHERRCPQRARQRAAPAAARGSRACKGLGACRARSFTWVPS
jgi:hypothetical protein